MPFATGSTSTLPRMTAVPGTTSPLPIVMPIISAYVALGAIRTREWLKSTGRARALRYSAVAFVGLFVALSAAKSLDDAGPNLLRPWHMQIAGTSFGDAAAWIRSNVQPGTAIMLGPTHLLQLSFFMPQYEFTRVPYDADDPTELLSMARNADCEYLVLPIDTFERRRWVFSSFVSESNDQLEASGPTPPGLDFLGNIASNGDVLAYRIAPGNGSTHPR